MPRNTSTYAVAKNRNGVRAAEREVRASAKVNASMPIAIEATTVKVIFVIKPLATVLITV